jgi:hypothetical protein
MDRVDKLGFTRSPAPESVLCFPDSISARLLNELSVQLAPALTYIYQKSITAGEVPDD